MIDIHDLIITWEAWDRYPGEENAAKALSEAVVKYADERNSTAPQTRRAVSLLKRQGKSTSQAILAFEASHTV